MSERRKDPVRLNKTSICSVVFLDIVGYSKKPDSEQINYKTRFNALVSDALKDVAQSDRIILDTGDGAAITLLGEPESALFISLTVRDGILESNRNHPDSPLDVRIGINLGPVQVVRDINNHLNIIGDGINVAQRVMSFAEPNQILVSRSYYEIVSRLSNDMLKMFSYSGVKHDKHVREHEVYVLRTASDLSSPVEDTLTEAVAAKPEIESGRRRRMIIAMVLVLLAVIAVAALVLFGKKAPAPIPGQPQPEMVVPPPQAEVVRGSPAPEVKPEASAPRKKQESKPVARKPAEDAAAVEQTTPQETKPAENSTSTSHPPPAEHKAADGKKSGLEKFTDSVKQGKEKPTCTDALRSLNQCK